MATLTQDQIKVLEQSRHRLVQLTRSLDSLITSLNQSNPFPPWYAPPTSHYHYRTQANQIHQGQLPIPSPHHLQQPLQRLRTPHLQPRPPLLPSRLPRPRIPNPHPIRHPPATPPHKTRSPRRRMGIARPRRRHRALRLNRRHDAAESERGWAGGENA